MLSQLHVSSKNELFTDITFCNGAKSVKPRGGFWTSTFNDEYLSDWVRWGLGEEFYSVDELSKSTLFILYPKKDIRIYTIDSVADAKKLFDMYERESDDPYQRKLDFEKLAIDFDGINLTEEGQEVTRHSEPNSFYGWDCESTVWFRWCFKRIEQYIHIW